MGDNKNIAVLFGGANSDNYRSCRAALDVIPALLRREYNVSVFAITLESIWVEFSDLKAIQAALAVPNFELSVESAERISGATLSALPPTSMAEVDLVFITLIGSPGTDGTIQGLLDAFGIKYAGSDMLSAALASDKSSFKLLLESVQIPTPRHIVISNRAWTRDPLPNVARATNLGLPVLIKPARGSNGLGITQVVKPQEMKNAIDVARTFDLRVISEKFYKNARYFECNILEDSKNRNYLSSIFETKLSNGAEIFNFIARADVKNFSHTVVKNLPKETVNLIQDYTEKIFELLRCSGYAQIEFLLTEEDELMVVEVNSQPNFANDSTFIQTWEANQLSYGDVIYACVQEGLGRKTGLI